MVRLPPAIRIYSAHHFSQTIDLFILPRPRNRRPTGKGWQRFRIRLTGCTATVLYSGHEYGWAEPATHGIGKLSDDGVHITIRMMASGGGTIGHGRSVTGEILSAHRFTAKDGNRAVCQSRSWPHRRECTKDLTVNVS